MAVVRWHYAPSEPVAGRAGSAGPYHMGIQTVAEWEVSSEIGQAYNLKATSPLALKSAADVALAQRPLKPADVGLL